MIKSMSGINIQYPYSQLIINNNKKIETRTYPLPQKYLNQNMYLIETPGKEKFSARIIGVIKFISIIKYKSQKNFNDDFKNHLVSKDSLFTWNDKPKYGWEVEVIKKFQSPIDFPKKKGIIFTTNIKI